MGVNDISFNLNDKGVMCSVGQDNVLQVWKEKSEFYVDEGEQEERDRNNHCCSYSDDELDSSCYRNVELDSVKHEHDNHNQGDQEDLNWHDYSGCCRDAEHDSCQL